MRTMSVSLALWLLTTSAYAQFSASDQRCQPNQANPGCPQDNPAYGVLSVLVEPLALNPALAIGSDEWQESHKPLMLNPNVRTDIIRFIAARPDWQDYYPRMGEYAIKLRPGETTVFEYLLLLYRLAKMDREALAGPAAKP